jgi:hypothetical protein
MFKKIIAFVFLAAIFLFFLEISTRFYLFGFNSLNYFKMNSVHSLAKSGLIRQSSPEIIYELKPNLDTYFKVAKFKTNSQGLRDKEYSIHKPLNTFRVAVLGDSFTMAVGVDIESAFHSVLEDRLNRESSGIQYEFINFGVGGYVPRQILATLEYKALNYNPDLVLLCVGTVEFNRWDMPEERYTQPYSIKRSTHPFFESFFIKLLKRSNLVNYFKHKFRKVNSNRNGSSADTLKTERVERLKSLFPEFQMISKMRHLPICIILLRNSDMAPRKLKVFKNLVDKFGFPFLDTRPPFKSLKTSDYLIYKIDGHPNATAHKMFATVIYEYLKQKNLLVKQSDNVLDPDNLSNTKR